MASGNVYIDNQPNLSGSFNGYTNGTGIGAKFGGAPVLGVPYGHISLHEKNINRPSGSIVYRIDETGFNEDHAPDDGINNFGIKIGQGFRNGCNGFSHTTVCRSRWFQKLS